MPLQRIINLEPFDKLEVDFLGHITPSAWHTCMQYIITMTNYLIGWEDVASIKHFSIDMAIHFFFENVLSRFGCTKVIMSDQGTHFINWTIDMLIE